jgi:hypothetical protein
MTKSRALLRVIRIDESVRYAAEAAQSGDLSIIVIDESGREVHRAQGYPNVCGAELAITFNKIG